MLLFSNLSKHIFLLSIVIKLNLRREKGNNNEWFQTKDSIRTK